MNTQDFPRGLTPEQHDAYRNEGFITVRGVFPDDEVERMRAECEALLSRPELFENDIPEAAARRDLNGDPVRDRLDPIAAVSPLFARTATDPRLVGLASSIFGSPAQLFKDKLIVKPPGVSGYAMHQDHAYWEWTGIPAAALIIVQVAIDDADTDNGAILFYPALHHGRLAAPAGEPRDVDEAAIDLDTVSPGRTRAGDVILFHSLTPHKSDPNRSDRPRRVLYFSYNDASYGDHYGRYYRQRNDA